MRETIKKCLAKAIMCQLENAPSADDLAMQTEIYGELFHVNELRDPVKIERRFNLWCSGNSRFPTPADILHLRISDYRPVKDQIPLIDTQVKRLPTKSETISASEFAAEHLEKMREVVGVAQP